MAYYTNDSIEQRLAQADTKLGVPAGTMLRMAQTESGMDPSAVNSRTGAAGLMQFMPATARQYGLRDRTDPMASIDASEAYMSDLLDKYNGDLRTALAAYNWGPGNVDRHGLGRAPEETRAYMDKIAGPSDAQSQDSGKPQEQARPWYQIVQSQEYQDLSDDEKKQTRDYYFDQVVAPQFSPEEQNSARQMFDDEADTLDQGRFKSALKSTAMGFGTTISALPKSIGELATVLSHKTGGDPNTQPEDTLSYQVGSAIDNWFAKHFQPNPRYNGEFWASGLPQGLGSTAGFALGGMAGRAVGVGKYVIPAGLGAAVGGVQQSEDYVQTQQAKGLEVDPKARDNAFLLGLPVGATEAIPVEHIFDRLDKLTGGGITEIIKNGIKGGLEELTQEVVQQMGQNYIANGILKYDEKRDTFEGAAQAGEIGGAVGFLLNALTSSLGVKFRGRKLNAPPVEETPNPPNVPPPEKGTVPGTGEQGPTEPPAPEPAPQPAPTPRPSKAPRNRVGPETPQPQRQIALDMAAEEAAAHPENPRPNPTPGQAAAGNYKVGRIVLDGVPVAIETPAGGTRKGKDATGGEWSVKMKSHYGYIENAKGADGDKLDVFINPVAQKGPDTVYVIDQVNPKTGKFDEHKVMLGYTSAGQASKAYAENFTKDWNGFGAITPMSHEEFKAWSKRTSGKIPVSLELRQKLMRKEYGGTERRKLFGERKAIEDMSPEEMKKELARLRGVEEKAFTSEVAGGIGNRELYKSVPKKSHQVFIDLDGLKWLNDNVGHHAGDEAIGALGKTLGKYTQEAYHLSGDEFVTQADSEAEVQKLLSAIKSDLNTLEKKYTTKDGENVVMKGVGFSWGVGSTLEAADIAMQRRKEGRYKELGIKRGDIPPGITPAEKPIPKVVTKEHFSEEELNRLAPRLPTALTRTQGLSAEEQDVRRKLAGKNLPEAIDHIATHDKSPAIRAVAERVHNKIYELMAHGVTFEFEVVPKTKMRGYPRAGGVANIDRMQRRVRVSINASIIQGYGKSGLNNTTLLHEAIHAVTSAALRYGEKHPGTEAHRLYKDLNGILAAIRRFGREAHAKRAKSGHFSLTEAEKFFIDNNSNALANERELVAWGLTNLEFQKAMDAIPYQTHTSLWTHFVTSIRRMLGLPAKAQTALSSMLRTSEKLMSLHPERIFPKNPSAYGQSNTDTDSIIDQRREDKPLPESVAAGPFTAKITPLSGVLYRETGPENLMGMLQDDATNGISGKNGTNLYVTDDKTLAIGQGINTGVMVTMRGERLSGVENKKPGTGVIGGREYIVNYVGNNAIERIDVKKGVKITRGLTRHYLRTNFNRIENADGSTTYLPKGVPNDTITDQSINYGPDQQTYREIKGVTSSLLDSVRAILGRNVDGKAIIKQGTEEINALDKRVGTLDNLIRRNLKSDKVAPADKARLKKYMKMAKALQMDRDTILARTNDAVTAFNNLGSKSLMGKVIGALSPQQKKLAEALFWGTENNTDLSNKPDQLKKQFGLNDEAVDAYMRIRKFFDQSMAEYKYRMMERIGLTRPQIMKLVSGEELQPVKGQLTEGQVALAKKMMTDFDGVKGYFPLMRHGHLSVAVRNPAGDLIYFSLQESAAAHGRELAKIRKAYPKEFNVESGRIEQGMEESLIMDPRLLSMIKEYAELAENEGIKDFANELEQKLLKSFAERSFRKRFIHRNLVRGYSKDIVRSLASYGWSSANYLSKMRYIPELRKLRDALDQRAMPQIREKLARDINYLEKPGEEFARFKTIVFAMYMGLNVKSAMVNLTQVPLTLYPYLANRHNDARAINAIQKAWRKTMANRATGDARLDTILRWAEVEGLTMDQYLSELIGAAHGKRLAMAKGRSRLLEGMTSMFSAAEKWNRRTSVAALYYLEGAQYKDHPAWAKGEIPEALKNSIQQVVQKTQFDYGKFNRPRAFRGFGGIPLQFNQFMVNYLQFLVGNGGGVGATVRSLAVLFVAVGAMGMPGADDLRALIEYLTEKMTGEHLDLEKEGRKGLVELGSHIMSDESARVAAEWVLRGHGAVSPWDISGSLQVGNIVPGFAQFFDTAETEGVKEGLMRAGERAIGAGPTLLLNAAKASEDYSVSGDEWRLAEAAMPNAAIKSILKAARIHAEGVDRNIRGKVTIAYEPTTLDIVGQTLGFQPAERSLLYRIKNSGRREEMFLKMAHERLIVPLALAVADRDDDARVAAMNRILEWNREVPRKWVLPLPKVWKSLRTRRKGFTPGIEAQTGVRVKQLRKSALEDLGLYPIRE